MTWINIRYTTMAANGLNGINYQDTRKKLGTETKQIGLLSMNSTKPIIDICCGSRMFWIDRKNHDTIFCDKRRESHELNDISSSGGKRTITIDPDLQVDFTALPFPDNSFALVVFDPPHLIRNGRKSWLAKKYGKLGNDWREEISKGFSEGFRILKPEGVLIFKWNEHEIPVSQVLALTPEKPLIGNRCGKTAKSHWIVFMKDEQCET